MFQQALTPNNRGYGGLFAYLSYWFPVSCLLLFFLLCSSGRALGPINHLRFLPGCPQRGHCKKHDKPIKHTACYVPYYFFVSSSSITCSCCTKFLVSLIILFSSKYAFEKPSIPATNIRYTIRLRHFANRVNILSVQKIILIKFGIFEY